MADFAISSDPAVQAQLDRLAALSPGGDVLGLDRITRLLAALGDPHARLPPVFHVAGTNGKGSTCAYLRAALEAAGHKVHVYTSPHLVRFNERIRIAGTLIDDAHLAALLREVLDAGGDIAPSFFEVTTAAAFLAFAREPADACVIEVGLGGRLDATNVIAHPLVTGIAQLGLDHQAFLGPTLTGIAAEKAGIAKAGVPLVTLHYPAPLLDRIGQAVRASGAAWLAKGGMWDASAYRGRLHYRDEAGALELPLPRLAGAHQAQNAGLAVAMLRHQHALAVPPSALRAAMGWAEWPARLQRLGDGPLRARLPEGSALWLDGGHNPAAAQAIAAHMRKAAKGRPFHLVLGLLANKDAAGVLAPLGKLGGTLHAVPVPGHEHHAAEALARLGADAGFVVAPPADDVASALTAITAACGDGPAPVVLVAGSLYLAGAVLAANGPLPD